MRPFFFAVPALGAGGVAGKIGFESFFCQTHGSLFFCEESAFSLLEFDM